MELGERKQMMGLKPASSIAIVPSTKADGNGLASPASKEFAALKP